MFEKVRQGLLRHAAKGFLVALFFLLLHTLHKHWQSLPYRCIFDWEFVHYVQEILVFATVFLGILALIHNWNRIWGNSNGLYANSHKLFLATFALLAIHTIHEDWTSLPWRFIFDWDAVEYVQAILVVATVVFGFLALFRNRDKIFAKLETAAEQQTEKERKDEFRTKFPRVGRVPLVGWCCRWLYGQGWVYCVGLLAILVVGVVYLAYTASHYWVPTDEGRLLYDSSLILQGMVPLQDFYARSVPLIYTVALSQEAFGTTLLAGRIVSVVSLLVSVFLIYLIGKEIHGKKVGLLASFLMIFYPWVEEFTPTQTHPFNMLWVLLFLYLLVLGLKRDRCSFLLCAGTVLGLTVLIRESSAILVLTLPLLIAYLYRNRSFGSMLRTYAYVFVPFLVIVVASFLVFGSSSAGVTGLTTGNNSMSTSTMVDHLFGAIPFILLFVPFVIPLFLCSLAVIGASYWRDSFNLDLEAKLNNGILSYWLGSLILFYLGYAIVSKFHDEYFREFFPVFALMTAVVTVFCFRVIRESYHKPTVFCFRMIGESYSKSVSVSMAVLLPLAVFGVIYICFFASVNIREAEVRPRYTLEAVDEVSSYIQDNTDAGDRIFCGSPIWAYMSERDNAAYFSHGAEMFDIERDFRRRKVKYVILDGKTEKILKQSAYLILEVDNHYREVMRVREGSHWDIVVLERRP